MKKHLKAVISIVLIFALLASYTPVIASAAPQKPTALSSNIVAVGDVSLVPPFTSSGAANTAAKTVVSAGDSVWVFRTDSNSKLCYCVEPGARIGDESTIDTAVTNKYWTALTKSAAYQNIVKGVRRAVAIADYLNPGKDADMQAVHQIVIWEIICGIRDPLTGVALKPTLQSKFKNAATTNQNTYYNNRYNAFCAALQAFDDIPNCLYAQEILAKRNPVTLNWNASLKRYQATVTDSTGSLASMNLTGVFPDYVHVSRSGNTLTIWTTTEIPNVLVSSRINKNHGFNTSTTESMVIYGGNTADGDTAQALVSSSVPDPMSAFLAVKTGQAPTIQLMNAKTWSDNGDQDGIRPDSITIRLWADGTEIQSLVVTEADGWAWTFEGLPKYRDGGIEIVYTITEDPIPGYTTVIDGFDVINTHIPETTEVNGSKTWDDANNQDGIRPDSITVRLWADGIEIQSATVTEADNWAWSFTELPKYRDHGTEIVYEITENAVDGYTTEINGFDVTNTHVPETTEVNGLKTWDDANNQDGLRPEKITVRLMRDGEEYDVKTVTAENEWNYSWKGLDKYRDGGKEIVWTVVEDEVPHYVTSYEGYTIVNTLIPEKTEIGGTKTWVDNNNQDGVRPEKIIVRLFRDGEEFLTQEVTDVEGVWSYLFTDLDVYRDGGVKIEWTITEDAVEGYTTTYDGTNIINTHDTATTDVAGAKTWVDDNDRDGLRPDSITVRLYRDGTEFDAKTVTAEDEWKYAWTGLDKYRDGGVEIIWTITEDPIDGYVTTYDGYNITNTHEIETITISGCKIWNDGSNAAELRPESVMLTLCADGEEIDTAEVTMTDAESPDVWEYKFVNLPAYKEGKKISYTIMEKPVANYTAVVQGFDITNSIVPPTDSPKTGDNSRAALPKLMIVMAIASVVSGGACIALVIRRRKQKRNRQ